MRVEPVETCSNCFRLKHVESTPEVHYSTVAEKHKRLNPLVVTARVPAIYMNDFWDANALWSAKNRCRGS